MHSQFLLDLAAELLRQVLKFQQAADTTVAAFFRQHRQLGVRERHALADTVYAVLRARLFFQHLAQGTNGPLERRLAILAWPDGGSALHSALSPQEQAWLAQARSVDRSALPEKLRHNLPDWLAAILQRELDEQFWPLVQSLGQGAPLDLRVNLLKAKRDDVQRELAAAAVASDPTPYSPWGLRLHGKPALHKVAAFAAGAFEVQDEGSQLLALLTDAKRGEMVVDFCAGAGGKTLALGAAMRNTGRLYPFDVSGHRLDAIKPRLARSGLSNVHPVQIAHERDDRIRRLTGKVDRVLVDAPCSGLGTLRRNPDLKWRQSPALLSDLLARQAAILRSAARLLKPGGRLVYATCSLLQSENEQVAEAFTAEQGASFEVLPAQGLLEAGRVAAAADLVSGPYLRLWPHRHRSDGFFAAAWRRS